MTQEVAPEKQLSEQHNSLMLDITAAIPAAVDTLAKHSESWTGYDYVIGKPMPLRPGSFGWKPRQVGMWRLSGLYHPLWLGKDGIIYRAFNIMHMSDPEENPRSYWKRAEYEWRDVEGLQRILRELKAVASKAS